MAPDLMKLRGYHDPITGTSLNEEDGCDLVDWSSRFPSCSFAMHPEGFPIFLPPDRLEIQDEYLFGDLHKVADRIDSEFQKRRVEVTLELISEAVGKQRSEAIKALDLGCGEGHITRRVQERFPKTVLWGLDHSVTAIRHAKRSCPEVEFSVSDVCSPPFESRFFDIVICNNVIEHVDSPLALLKAAARVTRKGGHLVLSTPSRFRLDNIQRIALGRPTKLMAVDHVTEYTVGQLKELLKNAGFETLAVRSRGVGRYQGRFLRGIATGVAKKTLEMILKVMKLEEQSLESTIFFLSVKSSA